MGLAGSAAYTANWLKQIDQESAVAAALAQGRRTSQGLAARAGAWGDDLAGGGMKYADDPGAVKANKAAGRLDGVDDLRYTGAGSGREGWREAGEGGGGGPAGGPAPARWDARAGRWRDTVNGQFVSAENARIQGRELIVGEGADDTITLYHATNTAGAENIRRTGIDPRYGRTEADFGQGFYMMPNRLQAQEWAERIATRKGGSPVILVFRVPTSELQSLNSLVFTEPAEAWQAFVTAHRTPGTPMHSYDLVSGPLAVFDRAKGAWMPHPNPSYWQVSIHTGKVAGIFQRGLLP